MIRNVAIITIVLFVCIIAGCHSMEPEENKTIQRKEVKGLTLTYLLDSLNINPIAVSDSDKRYIKEYKKIPDDFRINFDFPKLQDGSWMLIGRAYGKPRYVVQVKNGKKHGYCFIVDEKTGVVRNIDLYIDGKRNGISVSYNMRGIKDGISFFFK